MNSKPTDKSNVENPPLDEPPADDLPSDNPREDNPPADNPPTDNPPVDDPPVDDPTEDDPVPSLDSSVDSDEFKCKHCEVDPFPNENELKQHIKLKHEIKVSGSKRSFLTPICELWTKNPQTGNMVERHLWTKNPHNFFFGKFKKHLFTF